MDTKKASQDLKPAVSGYAATAIVIGSVIGSGIFVSASGMARSSVNGTTLLGIWVVAGLITLIGALTQCELCSQFPKTGGLYVYLREAFGDAVGFFYGWAYLTIAGSGGLAALAFIFSNYLGEFITLPVASKEWQDVTLHIPWLGSLYPYANLGEKLVGSALIIFLTWFNVRGVKLGATLQAFSTTAKLIALLIIIICGLTWSGGTLSHIITPRVSFPALSTWQSITLIMTALGGAFWAYDGWGSVTTIAEEVKRPERIIPMALILGTLIIILIYVLVNIAYLHVFSIEELGAIPGDRAASSLMHHVMGPQGAQAVALLVLLSTFDTLNSSILTNARIYFAMARDRLFPKITGKVHPRYQTPAVSLWLQCVCSLILLLTGSFDLVTSMYVWVNWLFYFLMAIAVFVCRRKNIPRTFTLRGYPYLPASFAIFTFFYLGFTLVIDILAYQAGEAPTVKSLMGLVLVLTGWPLYKRLSRKK